MRFVTVFPDGEVGYVEESLGMDIEIVGAQKIEIDEETYNVLKNNHKDYTWDKESNTIKRKEPKEVKDK